MADRQQSHDDLDQLVSLMQRLSDLSADIVDVYEPAAKRFGCYLLVAHLQSFRRASDSGTAAS